MKIAKLLFLFKIAFQNLKEKKIRSLLTMLSIALSVALVSSIVNDLYSDLYTSYNSGKASAGTWLYSYSQEGLEKASKVDKIVSKKKQSMKSLLGTAQLNEQFYIELYAQSDFDICPYYLYQGKYPTNDHEVLVTREYIYKTKHQIGDHIKMEFTDIDDTQKSFYKDLIITGIIQNNGARSDEEGYVDNFYILSSQKTSQYHVYVVTESITQQQLMDMEKIIGDGTWGDITLHPSDEIINTYLGKSIVSFERLDTSQCMMLACLFVMMFLTIQNIFVIDFKQRQYMFGLMSSMGATFFDLNLMVVLEVILYTLISCPIGLSMGYFGTKFIHDTCISMMLAQRSYTNMFPSPFITSPLVSFAVLFVTIVILSLSALSALKQIKKKEIIELIRNRYSSLIIHHQQKSLLLKSKHFWVPLSMKYQWIHRKKYYSILLTLIFSIIFFNVGSYSMSINDQLKNQTYRHDLLEVALQIDLSQYADHLDDIIHRVTEKNPQKMSTVSFSPPIGTCYSVSLDSLTHEYIENFSKVNQENIITEVIGVDEDLFKKVTGQKEPIFLNKRTLKVGTRKTKDIPIFEDHVPITLAFANDYLKDDVWVKDRLSFDVIPQGMYDIKDFGIENVSYNDDDMLYVVVVAPYSYFMDLYQNITMKKSIMTTIMINMYTNDKKGVKTSLVEDEGLDDYLTEVNDPMGENKTISYRSLIIQMMTIFMFLVCIMNLSIVVMSNIFERKNDYAILESLGIQYKDMKKMIYFENISLILLALIISIPTTIFIEGWMYYYQYTFLNTFQPSYQLLTIITISSIIVIILTSHFAYRSVIKQQIANKLKKNDF